MNKKISILITFILVLLVISSTAMFIFWLPDVVIYIGDFTNKSYSVIYVLSSVIYTLTIAIFITGSYFIYAIHKDIIFNKNTSTVLNVIGIMLILNCTILIASSIWILSIGESLLSPALIFVSALGYTVSSVLLILSSYVKKATELKEEVDLTL
ncbi:MAG: DUF2975 domain-containing protein [Clostridia bacterium]|nr:DUF2975 domain-containing protein [Clostridia bacterium]